MPFLNIFIKHSRSLFLACGMALSGIGSAACAQNLVGRPASDRATEGKPNVLFIVCDDLNCDIACYGHPLVKTPNIDRLAMRGVRFDRAYCQFPLCGPSRASFMTGLYPDQTLVRRNSVYIREHLPDVTTMPQLFRSKGYMATRVGKMYHYQVPKHIGTAGHDDPYSWSNTFNPEGRDVWDEDKIFSLRPGAFGGTLSWLATDGDDDEHTDGIGAAYAEQMLERFARRKIPFFLAVGLYRPHTPFVAPKTYFDLYPLGSIQIPEVPDGYLDTIPKPARTSVTRKVNSLDPALARQAIQAYYASITFADAQVGKVLDALTKNGLEDSTIVVFTSDHGYHMGEHGHYQKTTLFENATRVPLIIATPEVVSDWHGLEPFAQDESTNSLAEMVDIYPTVAELAGIPTPDFLAGSSQISTLQLPTYSSRDSALSQYSNGYSLRTDRYRFTAWGKNGADGVELYDHTSDSAEMHNLAGSSDHAELIKTLHEKLDARIAAASTPPKGIKQETYDPRRKVPQPPVRH